jgi:hypothetical protein
MDGQQRFGRGNAWPYELRSRERLTHRFDRVFAPLPWRADDSYWLTPDGYAPLACSGEGPWKSCEELASLHEVKAYFAVRK